MKNSSKVTVALAGNPNTGKTSLFNQLTGLHQKVANYPGITVEKKQGNCKLPGGKTAVITDLPGTYSINPASPDESVVLDTLLFTDRKEYPDVVVVVADIQNLKRNLLLFTQIKDLGFPTILAINMADQMQRKAISIDSGKLEKELQTKVVLVSARKNTGIAELKETISDFESLKKEPLIDMASLNGSFFKTLETEVGAKTLYKTWLFASRIKNSNSFVKEQDSLQGVFQDIPESEIKRLKHKEAIRRYQFINATLKETYTVDPSRATDLRGRLDRILTHKVFGYLIFFVLLLFMFQSVFNWAGYPMDQIDSLFAALSEITTNILPEGPFTRLIAEGVIPGVGGVVIFIPQIAILFLFISLFEESGYMSRVVFLMDKTMRKFGLNGKSLVPLISGTACAIPAIMASRNIENRKERLITILVTPFTTCSARLPVYTLIIALVIPDQKIWWFFNLQGLMLMALYLLGFASALFAAFVLHKTMALKSNSLFVIEMPEYRMPLLKDVVYTVVEKTKAFVLGAGKIILAISIVLWVLASYGPGESFENASEIVKAQAENKDLDETELQDKIAAYKLGQSYIGLMGKAIEPVIEPLGYDWKIGIALITSFAAREVFVGTLATIYSVGSSSDNETTIKQRMEAEINPKTNQKRFTFPVGISLLLFYAFAMQCMSTVAVVKKETNSWKWPFFQLMFMSVMAYLLSMLAFNILK